MFGDRPVSCHDCTCDESSSMSLQYHLTTLRAGVAAPLSPFDAIRAGARERSSAGGSSAGAPGVGLSRSTRWAPTHMGRSVARRTAGRGRGEGGGDKG